MTTPAPKSSPDLPLGADERAQAVARQLIERLRREVRGRLDVLDAPVPVGWQYARLLAALARRG